MELREYRVTGMTCGHCEASVREEVGEIAGVNNIDVSAGTGLLRFEAPETVTDDSVLAAVAEAGYSAVRA